MNFAGDSRKTIIFALISYSLSRDVTNTDSDWLIEDATEEEINKRWIRWIMQYIITASFHVLVMMFFQVTNYIGQ